MSWEHETVATVGETKKRRAVLGRGWTETSCCAACRGGESSTTTVDSHGEEEKLWGSSWKRRGDRVFAQRGQLVSTATAFSREGDTDGIGRGSVFGVASVVVAEDAGYGGGGGREDAEVVVVVQRAYRAGPTLALDKSRREICPLLPRAAPLEEILSSFRL